MCGRYHILNNLYIEEACKQLKLFEQQSNLRFNDDVSPGSTISIAIEHSGSRHIVDANWWLLQRFDGHSFKPNYQYASFNSRADKLNLPSSIAYQPFRQSRCIIPASGFVEGQDSHYHTLSPAGSAIMFGGLYNTWLNPNTGEVSHSASIITLPGHPKLANIHKKSLPLMLPGDNQPLIDAWLDPQFNNVDSFHVFLKPRLTVDFSAIEIDKPSKRTPVGPEVLIERDDE